MFIIRDLRFRSRKCSVKWNWIAFYVFNNHFLSLVTKRRENFVVYVRSICIRDPFSVSESFAWCTQPMQENDHGTVKHVTWYAFTRPLTISQCFLKATQVKLFRIKVISGYLNPLNISQIRFVILACFHHRYGILCLGWGHRSVRVFGLIGATLDACRGLSLTFFSHIKREMSSKLLTGDVASLISAAQAGMWARTIFSKKKLILLTNAARDLSYSPYSKFRYVAI